MISVKDCLIKNDFDVEKTSKELGIGESLITRHLPSCFVPKKGGVSREDITRAIEYLERVEKAKRKLIGPKKEVKKPVKKIETLADKYNPYNKEERYFATNKERLEHADKIINKDWL